MFVNGDGFMLFSYFFRYVKSKIASKWWRTVVFQNVIVVWPVPLQAQLKYPGIGFQRLQTLILMKLEKKT